MPISMVNVQKLHLVRRVMVVPLCLLFFIIGFLELQVSLMRSTLVALVLLSPLVLKIIGARTSNFRCSSIKPSPLILPDLLVHIFDGRNPYFIVSIYHVFEFKV